MFIVIVKYIKPLEEVLKVVPAHRIFLDKYYASGNFIVSGRQDPPMGGLILAKASSREEIEAITREDPFCIQGVAEYEFIEFGPTKYALEFEVFLD